MIDLHTHTTISDGIFTPQELVERAIKRGIKVLCITDHNAVNTDLFKLREKYPCIELPSGCEFSCGYVTKSGRCVQLHIGGIGFDIADKEINDIIRHNRASMKPYAEKVLNKLKSECSIDLCTYEELLRRNSNSLTVGRKHIAVEMVRQGICKDVDDAFDRFLGKGMPAFVSNAKYFAPFERVVRAIVNAGGVASLCHLYQYKLDEEDTKTLLLEFSQLTNGCGAIEVYYSSYDESRQNELLNLSKSYKLLASGGSDFHGDGKVKELSAYPYEIYVEIKKKIRDKACFD